MPVIAYKDKDTMAACDLTEALQNLALAAPFTRFDNDQMTAIRQLAEIFVQGAGIDFAPAPRVPP
jgi:hypothetical protein